MNLSRNSLNLIKILSNDPEKLKKINLLNDEEMIYNYIKSEIMPAYTKEDFNEFKYALSKLEEIKTKENIRSVSEESLEGISGGSYGYDLMESYMDGYNSSEGGKISNVITNTGNVVTKVINSIKKNFDKK